LFCGQHRDQRNRTRTKAKAKAQRARNKFEIPIQKINWDDNWEIASANIQFIDLVLFTPQS